jgi:hypothetical protein
LRGEVLIFGDAENVPPATDESKAKKLHLDTMQLLGGKADPDNPPEAALSFRLAAELPTDLEFKQTLLSMRSEQERLATLIEYYEAVIPKLQAMQRGRKLSQGNGHAR